MDDLEMLAELLAKPEPSGDVIGRGRDQLTGAIRAPARLSGPGPGRRRPGGLVAGAIGLTAAAAAVIVVASGLATSGRSVPTATATVPASTHSSGPAVYPRAVVSSPGQKILLAAAATALRQHPGTYWHFKIRINVKGPKPPPGTHVTNTYESWIARDGKYWNAQPRCAAPPGTAVFEGPGLAGFGVGNIKMTYDVARRLPTNPAALAAWFAKYDPHNKYGAGFVANALVALQWQVPAPPDIRAAAFRALAELPGVKSLGPVKGGVGLLITFAHVPADEWIHLVIDPATSLVRSQSVNVGTTIIEKAGWTNRLPRIIPLPPKNACAS